jgi:hypothetical protein
MLNEALRRELLAMREEDRRVRTELANAGELGGPYVPRMEEVHIRNAARLRALISEHGWPVEDIVGKDGSEAAWLIAQHAIGEPESSEWLSPYCRPPLPIEQSRPGMPRIWKTGLPCRRAVHNASVRNGWMIPTTV